MRDSTPKIAAFLSMAGLLALLLAGQAQAGRDCGGLNQKSCWHIDPTKWCDGNLKYQPTGVPGQGRCVRREPKPAKAKCGGLNQKSCWHIDPTKWCEGNLQYKPTGIPGQGTCVTRQKKNCGNLNQHSCWHVNPARWCNGNLKYKPTGVPGQGTCILRVSNDDLKEVASSVVERIKTLGEDNPLANLRKCVNKPENRASVKRALGIQSANGINGILAACNVSPEGLRSYGANVLGSYHSDNAADSKAWHLAIGGVASGVAYVGIEGGIGYRVALQRSPEARFYVAGGLSVGVGLSGGGDIAVGLSYQNMPTAHWARDPGASVSYSGKFAYVGGVAVDFSADSVVPSGFTLSGGVGGGVEAGVVTASVDQYLYNF